MTRKSKKNPYLRLLTYLKPFWARVLLILFFIVISSAGTLVSPFALKIIIDDAFPSGNFNFLLGILAVLVVVNVVRIIVDVYADYLHEWVSGRVILNIRKDLFHHVLQLPMNYFSANQKGDLVQRINYEVGIVENAMTNTLIRLLYNVLVIVGLAAVLSYLNFQLFLLSLLVIPFIYLSINYFQPKIQAITEKIREREGVLNSFFIERFENIMLIKAYNQYKQELAKLHNKSFNLINANIRQAMLRAGNNGTSTFLVSLMPILIFGWGGRDVMSGAMTLGALVAFLQYLNRIFAPFRDMINLQVEMVQARSSVKRMFEIMDEHTEIRLNKFQSKRLNINQVEFKDISLKYEDKTILDQLNLKLQKGKSYALVGPSGTGKSSLVKMLGRYCDPLGGQILIDGRDINTIHPDTLRSSCGYLSQEHQLFHDSILENIRYANPNVDLSKVKEVSELAGVDSITKKLDNNFNTLVGDRGAKLSGGERQRIAIARELVRPASVVIFDESTSALDSESENQLWQKLLNVYKDNIVIAVSHRLSTVKHFDEIICLKEGKVAEQGTHEHLVKNNGPYYKLFEEQLQV